MAALGQQLEKGAKLPLELGDQPNGNKNKLKIPASKNKARVTTTESKVICSKLMMVAGEMPPPPPPPGPPPPPMMPAILAAPSGQQRDMLLQSIRQGTKLKKTVTVDKSGPFIAGKVSGSSSSVESSRDVTSSNGPVKQMNVNGGPPGLGNLFSGGMPKLKPTGLGIGSTMSSMTNREGSTARSLSTETKSKGPPPQPPPATHKPQIPSSASDSVLTSSHTATRPSNSPLILPSKPPVGGYGKPNVAPKPPVAKEPSSPQPSFLHSNAAESDHSKPSPPPKKISLNGRPGVNRAQSMRVPKSPPVAPPTSPPFPPSKHNLVKNQSSLHQSQEGINGRSFAGSKTGTLPHNFQKLALCPPNNPPPPAPSQRTPTRPPVSRPPSRPAPPPAPPPPPPHRTSPAPPPPSLQGRTTSAASSSVPPPPPVRNMSVRNGSIHFQTEIENRFAHLFHHMNEFPDPGVFRNLVKNYNTKASVIAKQPAPPPPVLPTTVQLGNKMWASNTSHC